MSIDVRNAVSKWIADQGLRDPSVLSAEDFSNVRVLLGNDRKGFGVFISMMMFERQRAQAMLTNADLSNSAGAVAAAKLQGIILAVDTMRETVLNIADPIGEGSDTAQREIAGVKFNG